MQLLHRRRRGTIDTILRLDCNASGLCRNSQIRHKYWQDRRLSLQYRDHHLIRVVNGKQQEFLVHIDRLIKEGDISANVDILPGDILIIPEAWF